MALRGGHRVDAVVPSRPLIEGNLKADGQRGEGLIALLGIGYHDGVHETAGDDRVSWAGGRVHDPVYLDDDLAVVGFCRLADGKRVAGHVHVIKRDVALAVCGGTLDQRDRDFG